MAFWWVNHKQTRDHEVRGGYLWSPMRNSNGGYNQTYNFGTLTGTANITNFDGANYSAPLTGSGTIFTGNLTGPANRTGVLAGIFFGPSAAVTGGGFAIQNPAGTYVASGAFAGR